MLAQKEIMAIVVNEALVQERLVERGSHGPTGPRDEDRIAVLGMKVGDKVGITPAASIRQRQRDNVVELVSVMKADAVVSMTNFYRRVNSCIDDGKQHGMKLDRKLQSYPLGAAYDSLFDREQAIQMLAGIGVEATDKTLVPIVVVTRVA